MDTGWLGTTAAGAGMVVVSAAGIYFSVILLTRLAGLRSFAKISSYDFAMTVAVGSLVATTLLMPDPPLLRAFVGLAALYGLQILVSLLRTHFQPSRAVVDNAPLLLMAGPRLLRENMKRARLTEGDLMAKLREANVLRLEQVRAVVMETTGDISVLHGQPDGPSLQPELLREVVGGRRLGREDRESDSLPRPW